ncbi:hypothetical protein PTKIN_Ptkin07bG0073700 [Pterospermum kingtungense]
MSAHKARRIIDQINGRSYEETLMILELMPYRACYPIFKLVYSTAANASHNRGFNEASLVISQAAVNKGTTLKRLKPRARGRSYLIKRPTCHITIVLKDLEFAHLDATTILSRGLAAKGIYPVVDPLDSTSTMLQHRIIDEEHYETMQRVKQSLQRYKELQGIIATLGLVELFKEDRLTVVRARKVECFFSQPFS